MLAFFRWFCRREYMEDIEGDLLERFHSCKIKYGTGKARWSFALDVLKLCRPGIIRKLRSEPQVNFFQMKNINWIKIVCVNLVVVLMILSPFIPGPSNKTVLGISILGQIAGIFGLLLLPTGLAWATIEIRRLNSKTRNGNSQQLHFSIAVGATIFLLLAFLVAALVVPNPMPKISFLVGFAITLAGFILALRQIRQWKDNDEQDSQNGATVILAASAASSITFIYIFASLFAFVGVGIIPGILVLLFLPVGLSWIINGIKKLKDADEKKFSSAPFYLVTIPLIAFLTLFFLVRPASNFSRDFAIKNCAKIIASIEDYKATNGHYPESLDDLYPRYGEKTPKPAIMGISGFRYNKIGENYSLSFSQWLHLGSLEEIVLYDKNDLIDKFSAAPTKYDYKVDLWRIKGAFASHDTRYDNWRYYHVD